MAGNAGMGRPKGSLNKRTSALMELVEAGESPAAFGLRIMRDETQPLDVRLNAARLIAPYRPSQAITCGGDRDPHASGRLHA